MEPDKVTGVRGKLLGWLKREPAVPVVRDLLPEVPDALELAAVIRRAGSRPPADLAGLLISATRDGTSGGRAIVLGALQAVPARFWSDLDELLRKEWWHARAWSHGLAARISVGEADLLDLAVAGCHRNGFVREAAVASLAQHTQPVAITVLALRSGDWVDAVRDRARAVLAARLPSMTMDELAAVVDAAFLLEDRREDRWLAGRVRTRLRSLSALQMQAVLSVRFHRTRRSVYRTAIEAGQVTTEQLIVAAINDGDQLIRAMCARTVVARADAVQLYALAASRTALVRAEAVHALATRGELAAAEGALADPSVVVRTVARNALRRNGIEIVERYRVLAVVPFPPVGVIAGLGEVGDQQDTARFTAWLAHPKARARAAAVRSLRRIGVTELDLLTPMLHDSSTAVVGQVVTSLKRHADRLDAANLEGLLGPGQPAHTRRAAYRLLIAGNVWRRVIVDLRLISVEDDKLRQSARSDLTTWLHGQAATTYSMPTPEQARELEPLIQDARAVLGDRTVRLLRFHTGTLSDSQPGTA